MEVVQGPDATTIGLEEAAVGIQAGDSEDASVWTNRTNLHKHVGGINVLLLHIREQDANRVHGWHKEVAKRADLGL